MRIWQAETQGQIKHLFRMLFLRQVKTLTILTIPQNFTSLILYFWFFPSFILYFWYIPFQNVSFLSNCYSIFHFQEFFRDKLHKNWVSWNILLICWLPKTLKAFNVLCHKILYYCTLNLPLQFFCLWAPCKSSPQLNPLSHPLNPLSL